MKLDKNTLAQMIKEELEVILTDEEAVEMFGLESLIQEISPLRIEPEADPGDPDSALGLGSALRPPKVDKHGDYADPESREAKAAKFHGDVERHAAAGEEAAEEDENPVSRALKGGNVNLEENEIDEGCPDAYKRDEEEPLEEEEANEAATQMKENKLLMSRAELAEMIREEMARVIA